jgi:hypothetical protein
MRIWNCKKYGTHKKFEAGTDCIYAKKTQIVNEYVAECANEYCKHNLNYKTDEIYL